MALKKALWKNEDIESIVKNFGLCVITREGSNPQRYIENHAILKQFSNNFHIITERIANDISSTKIRDAGINFLCKQLDSRIFNHN